jgi:hypothetical protein
MKKTKTAKGIAKKQVAGKLLANVPEGNAFFCNDGQIFRNIEELRNGLNSMSNETFSYHSNCEKHDFSNWLKDIVCDERLARDLADPVTRLEAAMIVGSRIESLKNK